MKKIFIILKMWHGKNLGALKTFFKHTSIIKEPHNPIKCFLKITNKGLNNKIICILKITKKKEVFNNFKYGHNFIQTFICIFLFCFLHMTSV